MDKQTALGILGLPEGATDADIIASIAAKKKDIVSKRAAAPTAALQAKFDEVAARIQQAEAVLGVAGTAGSSEQPNRASDTPPPSSASSSSPASQSSGASRTGGTSTSGSRLSDTKLADLPGMEGQDLSSVEFNPGTMLANRYEIRELIGQGGMGAVYRAFDKNRDEDIAIKVLLPSFTRNERALERFLNEARISSKLSHPNIINVYDVQNDGELYFLTMELLEGQDLRQLMENQKAAGQLFAIDDVKEYIAAICEGLANAHESTVHRDIKPENIWIGADGKLKLMDFGIAQLQSTSQRTQTGAAMGTAYYMAPEQLKGLADIDGRADQYALAVLAYELLTGEVPAGAIEPVNELRKDIPKGMANAIMQALSPRPDNRFADIQAFNAAIQSGKGGRPAKKKAAAVNVGDKPNTALIAAGIAAAVVVIVLLFASGALDGLKPVDQDLLVEQENEGNALIGEIKILRKRMEDELSDLERKDREAARKGVAENDYDRVWWRLAEEHIEKSDQLVKLEGLQSAGESRLRRAKTNKEMEQALVSLREAKAVLVELNNQLSAVPDYIDSVIYMDQSGEKYDAHSKKYGIKQSPASLIKGNNLYDEGEVAIGQGDFVKAAQRYTAAGDAWLAAIDETADQVAKVEQRWKAERERKAKIAAEKRKRDLINKRKEQGALIAKEIDDLAFGYTKIKDGRFNTYNYSYVSQVSHSLSNNDNCVLTFWWKEREKWRAAETKLSRGEIAIVRWKTTKDEETGAYKYFLEFVPGKTVEIKGIRSSQGPDMVKLNFPYTITGYKEGKKEQVSSFYVPSEGRIGSVDAEIEKYAKLCGMNVVN